MIVHLDASQASWQSLCESLQTISQYSISRAIYTFLSCPSDFTDEALQLCRYLDIADQVSLISKFESAPKKSIVISIGGDDSSLERLSRVLNREEFQRGEFSDSESALVKEASTDGSASIDGFAQAASRGD